jgi:hypothetical protein
MTTTNGGGSGGWSDVATGCPHLTRPGLEIEVLKVTWCLSVRPGVDLDFRTSTDVQDQVLKSRSLDGRGGGRRLGGAGPGDWSGVTTGCPHSSS